MKDIKNYITEAEDQKIDPETYVIYEFSLNDLQSDNYLHKCASQTYGKRLIVARSWDWGGIRYHVHILKVRELKNCYAEWPKGWTSDKNVYIAPDELQGKDPKDIEEYIKKNNDKIDINDLMDRKKKIQINVRR